MKKYSYPTVLSIAGFDGSGGAGIQADTKTISALGCYATNILTALPVQNTQGVRNIFPIPLEVVEEQLDCIFDDIIPDAIKIGMVHTSELAKIISKKLKQFPEIPIVFDPVMVATSGHQLINQETIEVLVSELFPLSTIITPNMDEASVLVKKKIETLQDMEQNIEKLANLGAKSVLLKGGHLKTNVLTSLFIDRDKTIHSFVFPHFSTNNTHGSGCTLSSAIASYLALGKNLLEAVELGQKYVHTAIEQALDVKIGNGNGPLNHLFNPNKMIKNELE